eukprot:5716040-Pyramimonas_sp.AAC.1
MAPSFAGRIVPLLACVLIAACCLELATAARTSRPRPPTLPRETPRYRGPAPPAPKEAEVGPTVG